MNYFLSSPAYVTSKYRHNSTWLSWTIRNTICFVCLFYYAHSTPSQAAASVETVREGSSVGVDDKIINRGHVLFRNSPLSNVIYPPIHQEDYIVTTSSDVDSIPVTTSSSHDTPANAKVAYDVRRSKSGAVQGHEDTFHEGHDESGSTHPHSPPHQISGEDHEKCSNLLKGRIHDELTLAYHLTNAPAIFNWLWGTSAFVASACFLLWAKHVWQLTRVGNIIRRQNDTVFPPKLFAIQVKMFTFFPLIGVLGCASVFLPRFSLMFSLLLHLYEVACLMWFWELMVDLMDGPDMAVNTLSDHSPRRVWFVPPLCCLCWFSKPRHFRREDIVYSWWLVAQYSVLSVVSVLMAVISEKAKERFQYGTVVSLGMCMWGLFVIYRASHNESSEFHLTAKFVCLKLIVFVIKGAEIILRIEGLMIDSTGMYSQNVMSHIWTSFIPGMAALPFTLLAIYAFPTKDLYNRHVKHSASKAELPDILPTQASSKRGDEE
eukprot:GHVQ01020774.1.p1 GENE.GHVQ01020774.1~~GHVQ01020774.1.p1  ORF type:complete len:489 (+),score=51.56 GHVQ01020774.1:781-2247(+)